MSRAGYSDDVDDYRTFNLWRATVARAIKGKRGQAFLRDLLKAIENLPDKRLIAGNMESDGCVCSIGALGKSRGIDMKPIDELIESEWDDEAVGNKVASTFGIASALAREIMFMNDEARPDETDEQRYERMCRWVASNINSGEELRR